MPQSDVIDARGFVTNPAGTFGAEPNGVIGVAIHHSVTWYDMGDMSGASIAQETAHIRAIDAYHVQEGYGGFGYHYAVFPSGRLYQCGDVIESGRFAARAHITDENDKLVGVVFIGRFDAGFQTPTDAAKMAGVSACTIILDQMLKAKTRSGEWEIKGHDDWAVELNNHDPTGCPGNLENIASWFQDGEKYMQQPIDISNLSLSELQSLDAAVKAREAELDPEAPVDTNPAPAPTPDPIPEPFIPTQDPTPVPAPASVNQGIGILDADGNVLATIPFPPGGQMLALMNEGQAVFRIGDNDTGFPGRISKLIGTQYVWLVGAAAAVQAGSSSPAMWSISPGD